MRKITGIAMLIMASGTLVLAAQKPLNVASSYIDASYDFSLQPPPFAPAKNGSVMAVTMFAPVEDQFASNVNVMIQHASMTR